MHSPKPFLTIFIEASIVGILLIGFVKLIKDYILPHIPDISGNKNTIELILIAGFLFHMSFEYSGINAWYSKEYCKLL